MKLSRYILSKLDELDPITTSSTPSSTFLELSFVLTPLIRANVGARLALEDLLPVIRPFEIDVPVRWYRHEFRARKLLLFIAPFSAGRLA